MTKILVVPEEDAGLNGFTKDEFEVWQKIEMGMQDLLDGKVKIL